MLHLRSKTAKESFVSCPSKFMRFFQKILIFRNSFWFYFGFIENLEILQIVFVHFHFHCYRYRTSSLLFCHWAPGPRKWEFWYKHSKLLSNFFNFVYFITIIAVAVAVVGCFFLVYLFQILFVQKRNNSIENYGNLWFSFSRSSIPFSFQFLVLLNILYSSFIQMFVFWWKRGGESLQPSQIISFQTYLYYYSFHFFFSIFSSSVRSFWVIRIYSFQEKGKKGRSRLFKYKNIITSPIRN